MPNPVVSFEIRGPDPESLRAFYAAAFGWEIFVLPGGYALLETTSHEHGANETTVYTSSDAFMNDGVVLGSSGGQPAWKFTTEANWRGFERGIGGGIGEGSVGVTFYIQVPDLDAALRRVVECGGSILREPEEVAPNVVTASFSDPAGNQLALILAPR